MYADGSENPIFLSSGTEDYFLSAFYYDEGKKISKILFFRIV